MEKLFKKKNYFYDKKITIIVILSEYLNKFT